MIRAAGGAVVRLRGGDVEVLLVHRQAYDDWTFPKGKALPDETDEACAVREVEEETGLTCALDTELPSTVYRDARDRRKRVRYWLMRPVGGRLAFDHEVDDGRWLTLADASGLLTYERDAAVLAAVEIAMPGSEALEKGAFAG